MGLDLHAFANRDALMAAAADGIEAALRAGLAARGHACAALSGGATPAPAYALLAARALDWPNVSFALVDERWVALADPASNEAMLRRALAPALAQGAQLAPLYDADAPSSAAAAARAEARYRALRFDIALMGMGADGHTASWFAGARGLREALDPANPASVLALHAPRAPVSPDRLSLTVSALGRAGRIALLIAGADKRARLEAALHEAPDIAPVAALFNPPLPAPEILWAA